jgi:hypothetical protein
LIDVENVKIAGHLENHIGFLWIFPKKTMFGPIHLIPFVGHIINCLHCIPIRPIGRWQEALVAGGAGAPMVKMCLKRRYTQKNSRKYSNFTENIT